MNELYIIIGAYGSGKSEYSIHLSRKLKAQGFSVVLVDLDIVNPYFRTRDVQEALTQEGIEVIAPDGQFRYADVPMISPRIMGAIENQNKTVVLDAGGDRAGCRALVGFAEKVKSRGYRMVHVINTNRPFTSTPEDIVKMHEILETSSKLMITEVVCNSNLMELTDETTIKEGISILQSVAESQQLLFNIYLVLDKYADRVPDNLCGISREIMSYTLSKPWELAIKGI